MTVLNDSFEVRHKIYFHVIHVCNLMNGIHYGLSGRQCLLCYFHYGFPSVTLYMRLVQRNLHQEFIYYIYTPQYQRIALGFLRRLRFPLPIYIPFASPQSSSLSLEADTIGQEWPQCQ
jgi:hypothetical protein